MQSPAAARWHFLFFCCLLIRCAVVERLRHGLHAPMVAVDDQETLHDGDFLVQCVKAWKSYTLSVLLFKYLYGRGSEALSNQQPGFLGIPAGLPMHPGEASTEAVLAAEAAGIQTSSAREAAAHTASKLLCQVVSIDEAAVVIFRRFVSLLHSRRFGDLEMKQRLIT